VILAGRGARTSGVRPGPDGPPLRGVRVAVTRPADSAEELAAPLRRLGAEVELAPLIAVLPPPDPRPVAVAAQTLAQFDWIVFTSANAVRHFAALLPGPVPGDRPPHLRVAVVGPGTESAVRRDLGWSADACPAAYTGAALAAAMAAIEPLRGTNVLWPRARDAQDILPADLRAAGAILTAPVAYRTEPDPAAARRLIRLLDDDRLDAVTLTSPSAAQCLAGAGAIPHRVVVAVIGPTTAAAARDHGIPVHVQPEEHTIPGLVAALAGHFRHGREPDDA
jgi:uroporphyrinogen-III synthase